MAILSLENLTFLYSDNNTPILDNINISIKRGDFVVLAGRSGSGKSTLLQLIKSEIAPYGDTTGKIKYENNDIDLLDKKLLTKEIGFVFQDPENQIVMSTVLEELSFGLENFQYSADEMHKRIAEMVHFFDINHLVNRNTADLSGGEKQLINLAAVLLLEPNVLLLDEPLAQLDPIAATSFINTLKQLNEELGITIVIVEHNLNELLSTGNQLIILDEGKVLYDDIPREVMSQMLLTNSLTAFLPISSQLYFHFENKITNKKLPITVNETRRWIQSKQITVLPSEVSKKVTTELLLLKQIDFQYTRKSDLIIKNLNLIINEGEWLTIVGGNGTGKSTLLKIIVGILKQQHGHFVLSKKKHKKLNNQLLGYLPQTPKLIFIQDTLLAEFTTLADQYNFEQKELDDFIDIFQLRQLLHMHPFDLSGGELQRAALLATVLTKPKILILDEPTKGIDPEMKKVLGELLMRLQREGMTIVMVTHDIEFAAKYSTRCGLLFQGELVAISSAEEFFNGNAYYTTMMNRITRRSNVPVITTLEKAVKLWRVQK